jgi:glycosyltransferase involved in cell wall biosynthesis
MNSTLVIFTLNEIEAARRLFERIPFGKVSESIVIDGGSTDGTSEFFKKRGIPVIIQDRPGHGEAYKLGMRKAQGEILVFFGCDGNNQPEDIPRLIKEIEKGGDLVIASRFGKGAQSLDANLIRRFGNQLFVYLVNLRWQTKLTDVFNEFRAIRKDCMERMNLENSFFDLELEMTIKAIKNNFKITEVPTVEQPRMGGRAKLSTLRDGLMNLRCFLREAWLF